MGAVALVAVREGRRIPKAVRTHPDDCMTGSSGSAIETGNPAPAAVGVLVSWLGIGLGEWPCRVGGAALRYDVGFVEVRYTRGNHSIAAPTKFWLKSSWT